MVTTRNSDKDIINSDCGASLLLGRLILILNSTGHPASKYGDVLKYVHEKPACYNRCEKGTGAIALIMKNA
jgi:hypothetical protein